MSVSSTPVLGLVCLILTYCGAICSLIRRLSSFSGMNNSSVRRADARSCNSSTRRDGGRFTLTITLAIRHMFFRRFVRKSSYRLGLMLRDALSKSTVNFSSKVMFRALAMTSGFIIGLSSSILLKFSLLMIFKMVFG